MNQENTMFGFVNSAICYKFTDNLEEITAPPSRLNIR
jgi:hypothetical protein